MKNLSPAPLAPSPSLARWGLVLSLALTLASAQAQTLIDTSATVGISNTLMQQGTSNNMGALQRANNLKAQLQAQQGQQQQVLQQVDGQAAQAQAQASQGTSPAQVTAQPLTAQQQQNLSQARQLLSTGKHKQAQSAFEALIAQNYQQPEPHFGLALAMFAQNNLKGAKFEFAQYAALAPQSFEGAYNLGVIAARQGDHNEALKQFSEAAAKSAQASPVARRQVLDALAGEQLRRNDYASLVTTLTQAQVIDPSDAQLQLRLGQAMTLTGKGVDALPLLYTAMQTPAYRGEAVSLIADIYIAQNLPDRAVSSLNTAIAQAGNDAERADLLLRKAQVQNRLKQGKAALATAHEALQLDSRSAAAHAVLGQLLGDQGDKTGSVQAWQKATQYDSKNPAYLLNLAAAQLAAGQLTEGRQSAASAAKLSKDSSVDARAEFLQGVAAYRLKDYKGALSSLKASSTKLPSADTSLWLGLSSYALKDYPTALMAFNDSLKLQDTAEARLNLGATFLAMGMFKEAEPQLQTVVKIDSGNAQAWYQLGLARRALGNTAEARASFKMAAQLGYSAAYDELK